MAMAATAAAPAKIGRVRAWIANSGPVLGIFLAIFLLWELGCRLFKVPDFILPSPSVIIDKIVTSWWLLLVNGLVTAQEIVLGFGMSVAHRHPARRAGGLFAHLRARRLSLHGLAADHPEGRAGADPGDVARLRHPAEGDGGVPDLVLPDRHRRGGRHALGREGDDLSGAVDGRQRADDLPQDPAAAGAAQHLRRPQGRHGPGRGGRDRRRVHRRRAGPGLPAADLAGAARHGAAVRRGGGAVAARACCSSTSSPGSSGWRCRGTGCAPRCSSSGDGVTVGRRRRRSLCAAYRSAT